MNDDIAALLKSRFRGRRIKVEVPEIEENGEPLVFWCEPVSGEDARDFPKLFALPGAGAPFDIEGCAGLIAKKAQFEDGSSRFGKDAAPTLLAYIEADVLATVAARILETVITQEAALGNSDSTATREPG